MQRRRVWIGVGLLAALAGAFGLWRDGDRRGEDAAGSPVSPIPGAEDPPLPPAGVVVPDQESSAPRVELPDDANDVLTPSPEGSALVQLVGQVVDVGGRPLAGVEAALTSSGAWRQAADPPLPDRYVEQADADGRFRFEVSPPDAKRVRLVLTPDENHRIARRTFGEGHDEPPLAEGPHDLGQIVLGPAGRIEGTIRTVAGQPLVGASASLSVRGGWILRGKADEQGRYVIARVPPGSYRVEAIKNAFLHASRRGVVVNPGEMTFDVDFELSPSPSIAGRVVDAEGAGLEGVRLIAWPASHGSSARARSAADGSFRLDLPQDEPYTLEATLDGFAKYEPGRSVLHKPGTEGIEIVLRPSEDNVFLVRDQNGTTVERFGIRLFQVRTVDGNQMSVARHRDLPPFEDHPEGEARLEGDPTLHDYGIRAPGFAPRQGPVSPDVPGGRRQTVVLGPASTLRGRYLHGGEPVVGAGVSLERHVPIRRGGTVEPGAPAPMTEPDLTAFEGHPVHGTTGPDGSFVLGDLAGGTYDLEIQSSELAPATWEALRIDAGEVLDLGDLSAVVAAELTGVALLPAGRSVAGLELRVGGPHVGDHETAQVLGPDGAFRFGGLAAGTVYVHVSPEIGRVVRGNPFSFELSAGEQRRVTLDLGSLVPCTLEVEVLLGDEPAPDLQVQVELRSEFGFQRNSVGFTDDRGFCRAEVAEREELGLVAVSPRGQVLASLHPVRAVAGETLRIVLEGPAPASMTLLLPEGIEIDPRVPLVLTVLRDRSDGEPERSSVHLMGAPWNREGAVFTTEVGAMAPGPVRLELRHTSGQTFAWEGTLPSAKAVECPLRAVE